jgi:mannose-6-phosphate isomerase-like protein (cupin superfamily)
MSGGIDFATQFARLAADQQSEITLPTGGVDVRLVRVVGGVEGCWDSHNDSAETAIVWSGDFSVEFRDHTLHLSAGQACIVPLGVEHKGSSINGAEMILFRQSPPKA